MLDRVLSQLATVARFGHARTAGSGLGPRPEQALVLYGYEGCPMCRRVREAITDLALPVEIRPCPRGGVRFRPEAEALAGKQQFPLLIDPNTDRQLLESADIVAYLYANYGVGAPPSWLFGFGFVATSQLASLVRMPRLHASCAGVEPVSRLRLQGAEADPGARRVREYLDALELPYLWEPGPLRLVDAAASWVLEEADAILCHLARYAA